MIHYVIFRRSEWQRLGGLQILNPEFIIQDSPGLHNLEDFTVQVLSGVYIVLIIRVYYYSTERYTRTLLKTQKSIKVSPFSSYFRQHT